MSDLIFRMEKAEAELAILKSPSPHKWERVAFTPEFPNLDPEFYCVHCSETRRKGQDEPLPSGPCPSPYARIAELEAELAALRKRVEDAPTISVYFIQLVDEEGNLGSPNTMLGNGSYMLGNPFQLQRGQCVKALIVLTAGAGGEK